MLHFFFSKTSLLHHLLYGATSCCCCLWESGVVNDTICFDANVQPDTTIDATTSDKFDPEALVLAVAIATRVDGVVFPATAINDQAGFAGGNLVVMAVVGGDGVESVDADAAEANSVKTYSYS